MPPTAARIRNERSQRLLASRAHLATTFGTRLRGLLGREGLAPGEGLWIEPCTSIHMFFMRFAIDAVFVDSARRVTRLVPGIAPWRFASGGRGAQAVVELPVGTIDESDTRVGDRLSLQEL